MFLGFRPSIGWLGYLTIKNSPTRIMSVLLLFGGVSLYLMKHSKESFTIKFSNPVPGTSSIIIVPSPTYTSFNSFDACAVEAALALPLLQPKPNGKTRVKTPRPVLLYQWASNIGPGDTWVRVVSKIKGVKVVYMNLVKSLVNTPVVGMLASGGWGGRPDWAIWLAAGSSMLWKAGGILMPTGVLMTKHLALETFGNNSGLLVATNNNVVYPVAIGVPPHHRLTKEILTTVENFDFSLYSTLNYDPEALAGYLVTEAVEEVCQVLVLDEDNLQQSDECKGFKIIGQDAVTELGLHTPSSLEEERSSFFKITSMNSEQEQYDLKYDLERSKRFFRRHGLVKFCPSVYKFLEFEAKNYL